MEIDPIILATFGPPPKGIDLLAKQETAIITVALVSTAFATIALVLRIWARNFQRFGMMADDYLMIVALVCQLDFLARRCKLLIATRFSHMGRLLSLSWEPKLALACTSGPCIHRM